MGFSVSFSIWNIGSKMNKLLSCVRSSLTYIGLSFLLISCGGGGGNSGHNSIPVQEPYKLTTNYLSPTPIINDSTTEFYVYVYNTSKTDAHDLTWEVKSTLSSTSKPLFFSKVINLISLHDDKLTIPASDPPIRIIDSSECNNIPALTGCRIVISATSPGNAILEGSNSDGTIIIREILSAYPYKTAYSGPGDSLILSSTPKTMTLNNGFGSSTFSVINNSDSALDINNLLGDLPGGTNGSLADCVNPLPSHEACQIRLNYNATNLLNPINLKLPITLYAQIINQDGSISALPPQNSSSIINISSTQRANLEVSYAWMSLDANQTTTENTAIAYVKNKGTAPAILGSLLSNNAAFSLSDDNCSNQTLDPDQICSYSITANINMIKQSGNILITIPYNDNTENTNYSAFLYYKYTPITTVINPKISLSVVNSLNQTNLNGNLTITNIGNVALHNLKVPKIPASSNLGIIDQNGCGSKELASGMSCDYLVTYAPKAPSQDDSVNISGITASYISPSDNSPRNITFNNSASINVSSVFAGHLNLNAASLNISESNTNIIVTNDGNSKAKISSISVSPTSGNVQFRLTDPRSCTDGTELSPARSCTIYTYLSNTESPNSGNSIINVTYDNNNGTTSAIANNNISWVIGNAPSLTVGFSSNSLTTVVGTPITTTLTLTNNGNITLYDIKLPTLVNSTLTYESGGTCALSGQQLISQTLTTAAPNNSCTVILKYSPVIAEPQTAIALAPFTANTAYSSANYGIDVTAISPSAIVVSPTSLSKTLYWNNPSFSSNVTLTNVGGALATLTGISANDSQLSVSGCNMPGTLSLQSGESCVLTIISSYLNEPNSYVNNTNITVNYSDLAGTHSTALNVSANLNMKPVVAANMTISGALPTVITTGTQTTVNLTLTNNSTVSNNGDGSIQVDMANLDTSGFSATTTGAGSIHATLNTNGISNNPCSSTNSDVTLAPGESCSVNIVLNATGTVTNSNSNNFLVSITPSYKYKIYNDNSTLPDNSPLISVSSPLTANILVNDPVGLLSVTNYSPTAINLEQASDPSLASATITFKNTGSAALTGITMPTISGFSFFVPVECNTLAPQDSCTITVNISTTNVMSGNLSSSSLIFTDMYNNIGQTMNLPNISYNITPPGTANISTSITTNGCSSRSGGNGFTQTCNLNPASNATINGSAGAFKLVVTYSNAATETAKNFTIIPPVTMPANYTLSQNNCNDVTLANTQSCSIIYTITNPTNIGNFNLLSGTTLDNGYTYKYGLAGQASGSGSATLLPNNLVVSVTNAKLSLQPSSIQLLATLSESVTATLSNWYIATAPDIVSFTSSNSTIAEPPVGCYINMVSSGGTCSSIINTKTATGTTNLNASTVAPDGASSINSTIPTLLTTIAKVAYITNIYGSVNTLAIIKCTVSPLNNTLNNCAAGYPNDGTMVAVISTITTNGNYIYFVSQVTNSIQKCKISSADGSLSRCGGAISQLTVPNPQLITFNVGKAYIYDLSRGFIQCSIITADGSISGCQTMISSDPSAVNVMTFNNGYLYITYGQVYQCIISINSFSCSGLITPNFSSPNAITFNNNFVYLTSDDDYGASITSCHVSGDGIFGDCTTQPQTFNGLATLSSKNNFIYAMDSVDNAVYICSVSMSDGSISQCTSTGSLFSNPYGIAFYP